MVDGFQSKEHQQYSLEINLGHQKLAILAKMLSDIDAPYPNGLEKFREQMLTYITDYTDLCDLSDNVYLQMKIYLNECLNPSPRP